MDRRVFLKSLAAPSLAHRFASSSRTRHLIFIVPDGLRKQEYRGAASEMPNLERLAEEGFVFEEDHCEQIASHFGAFSELIRGIPSDSGLKSYPTILDYIGRGLQLQRIASIPTALAMQRPRIIVCRIRSCEIGHEDYARYLRAVRAMDESIGAVFNWVKRHPYFSTNTAIVFRPEFGRDDVVNEHGQLHHSYGFYSTHRVASIFWGPDFNSGVDRTTVIRAVDMAPTLTKLFSVDATFAQGRIIPGLLNSSWL